MTIDEPFCFLLFLESLEALYQCLGVDDIYVSLIYSGRLNKESVFMEDAATAFSGNHPINICQDTDAEWEPRYGSRALIKGKTINTERGFC